LSHNDAAHGNAYEAGEVPDQASIESDRDLHVENENDENENESEETLIISENEDDNSMENTGVVQEDDNSTGNTGVDEENEENSAANTGVDENELQGMEPDEDISVKETMNQRYGTWEHQHNLRPRKPRDYHHLYQDLEHTALTQYNVKKGLKVFGGNAAVA
jgi:hypothetical protein